MEMVNVQVQVAEAEVYRSGCTLTLRGWAKLPEGAVRVRVEGLPEGLDEGSIALRMQAGIGQGQVRVARSESGSGERDAQRQLSEQIDELDRRIDNKDLELTSWRQLATRMQGPSALDLLERLPVKLEELSRELADLRTQRNELLHQRNKLNERSARPQVLADLTVPQAGDYPLELLCRSSLAGWAPAYDVLVDALDQPLRLRLKGEVWQRTGDVWTDVALRLSTGTATVLGDLPRFFPRYLSKFEPVANMAYGSAPKMAGRPMMSRAGAHAGEHMLMAMAEAPMPDSAFDEVEELRAPEAEVSEQATVTTYELPGTQTLASDGTPQTITVVTSELAAHYRHYAYPRREEAAYLVAHLDVEPAAAVLEYPLSVYLEGSYVGTVSIGRTGDDEGYELPLGRDERVRVRRTEDVRRSKRLLGGRLTKEHVCSIMVQNRKAEPITLLLLEQVPVSRDKEIEVTLREGSGAAFDEERGELRWEREVPAGEQAQFAASYTVSHGKGVTVNASEQRLSVGSFTAPRGGRTLFCTKCGGPIEPGAAFCPRCGFSLS